MEEYHWMLLPKILDLFCQSDGNIFLVNFCDGLQYITSIQWLLINIFYCMTLTYQHDFYYFEKIKLLQYTFEKLLYEKYIF